jgi:hypothetical protein
VRAIRLVLLPLLSISGFAQLTGSVGAGSAGVFSTGNAQFSLRADPPSSRLPRLFTAAYRGRGGPDGRSFVIRYFSDRANHTYFGYEMMLEEQQPGTYLLTCGKLGLSPMEMSMEATPRLPLNARANSSALAPTNIPWIQLALPSIPEPRLIHQGDTASIELFVDPLTGDKLIDDVHIQPRYIPIPTGMRPSFQPIPPAAPTVSGEARDYSAADGEFQIVQPFVSVNGNDDAALRTPRAARGSLVWIYIPKHGRYILSLAPRPGLDFKKAGEVRGGVIAFVVGENSVKISCANSITTGDAAYHLYVLLDPDWEPTVAAQKALVSIGSVGVGELLALKK